MINRIRKSFVSAEECKHGGKVEEARSILGAEPLDFSANINPLGSPPLQELVIKELTEHRPLSGQQLHQFSPRCCSLRRRRYGEHRSRKRLIGIDQALRGGHSGRRGPGTDTFSHLWRVRKPGSSRRGNSQEEWRLARTACLTSATRI